MKARAVAQFSFVLVLVSSFLISPLSFANVHGGADLGSNSADLINSLVQMKDKHCRSIKGQNACNEDGCLWSEKNQNCQISPGQIREISDRVFYGNFIIMGVMAVAVIGVAGMVYACLEFGPKLFSDQAGAE